TDVGVTASPLAPGDTLLRAPNARILSSLDRKDRAGMARWQLQEAKQQFSKLVEQARQNGPQTVTRHGREVVVVLDVAEYERLRDGGRDFKRFLLEGPRFDDLPLGRSRELPRKVEL